MYELIKKKRSRSNIDADRVARSYLGHLEHPKQQKGLTLLGHKFHNWAL